MKQRFGLGFINSYINIFYGVIVKNRQSVYVYDLICYSFIQIYIIYGDLIYQDYRDCQLVVFIQFDILQFYRFGFGEFYMVCYNQIYCYILGFRWSSFIYLDIFLGLWFLYVQFVFQFEDKFWLYIGVVYFYGCLRFCYVFMIYFVYLFGVVW